ncbi:MAG: FAD-dependent oxidoreductase [Halieaceae bacterium]|jgi:glycine/D-amino acid oxidase-like deaminating enzyme|nr:FAD-dependent oxidoreductase [Halieaceae bacterium]
MTDLLVVGGGIVGLSAAVHAAQSGLSVIVVDAGVNAGTTSNAGSLHVQLQSRFMRLYPEQAHNVEASLPFYLEAVREWERLATELGPIDLVRKGGLMLAESAEQLDFLAAKAQREAAAGLDVAILDRSELNAVAPWLGPDIVGAELCRDEGKLNPLLANTHLRARAKEAGIGFVNDYVARLRAGDTLTVEGRAGSYRARQVLIAAAWGSGDLLGPFGLQLPTRAEPLHMNITEPADIAVDYLLQHAERSITLKQLKTGQIVIGGGWPARARAGGGVPQVLAASLLGNVALAAHLVPSLAPLRLLRSWAGMNTTVDGKTVLGRVPTEERIIVAVPGDAGYTLGPLCGRLAAEIAAERAPRSAYRIEAFAPRRFLS